MIIIRSVTNIISLRVAPLTYAVPPHIPLDSFWWVEYLVAALQRGANQYFRNILYCTADPPRSLVRASLFILLAKELLWQPSFTAG